MWNKLGTLGALRCGYLFIRHVLDTELLFFITDATKTILGITGCGSLHCSKALQRHLLNISCHCVSQ